MSPTPDRGPSADPTPTEPTLYDRMLVGELGQLIPAADARARLQMADEALRRYGDEAEGLLGCDLPTGSAGGRLYPAELMALMAQAKAAREAGHARSRGTALAALLAARGWITLPRDAGADDPASLGQVVEELHSASWRLTTVAPLLGGVIEEHRDVIRDLNTALTRVTLELPQVLPHLERIRSANETVTASARDLSRRADDLITLVTTLDAQMTAHHERSRRAHPAWAAFWPMVALATASGLTGAVFARVLGL